MSISKAEQLSKHTEPKLRQRKCKFCTRWFTPDRKGQETCSEQCAIDIIPKKRAKEKRKGLKQFRKTDKAVLMREAQTVFNRYIRYRDRDEPCISCGHKGGRQVHAGHYMPVGGNGNNRFNEDNCNSQCSICNNYKSGNLALYRESLIKKIGLEKVEKLEKKIAKVWTIEELTDIIATYKQKLKG